MSVDVSSLLCYFIISLILFVLLGLLVVYLTTSRYPDCIQYESEKFFKDPDSGFELCQFPSLKEPATIELSVIVPAYNEEKRLPPMLDECVDFLEGQRINDSSFSYEVLIVDDGSSDQTSELGLEYCRKLGTERIRVLTLAENRGKGGAVRMGMLRSRGKHLLFADADGATSFKDLTKLKACIDMLTTDAENVGVIAIGSRAHLEKESIAERSLFRTILMYGFHFMVWLFCVRSVRDTQCGFKLLTRAAARVCFSNLHIYGWAFDVELLYIAEKSRIPIGETAVTWTEIEGSKIVPFWSWLQMGKDLLLLWLRYTISIWRIDPKRKVD